MWLGPMVLTIGDAIASWCTVASHGLCDDGAQYVYVATLLSQQGLLSRHAILDTCLLLYFSDKLPQRK